MPDDCQGHSSNKQTYHGNATTVDVQDGRHPTKSVHSQHSKGHITEYGRHNAKIRIMHGNCQGFKNQGKRSALTAAIQLYQVDVVVVQYSRISVNNYDKPPIRVPNYHTYCIPASAECHDLITIVKTNMPSKKSPPPATSEGTDVLTVKVWIDKQPTLLHNVYRVRGETKQSILSCSQSKVKIHDQ